MLEYIKPQDLINGSLHAPKPKRTAYSSSNNSLTLLVEDPDHEQELKWPEYIEFLVNLVHTYIGPGGHGDKADTIFFPYIRTLIRWATSSVIPISPR